MTHTTLTILLQVFAGLQAAVAVLNFGLVRMLGWSEELQGQPLLLRQVFYVHMAFISLTVALFALLTWRFAAEMAQGTNQAVVWLAGGIGTFWLLRTLVQIFYYSPSHWRGHAGRTVVHILLVVIYGMMAGMYLFAALQG